MFPTICSLRSSALDEVGNVGRHLLDLGVVEGLDVPQVPHVALGDEVDTHTLSAETTGTTDTVDVVLSVGGQVVVDDERHLLDVDTTGQEIGGDEHARRAGAELPHDEVALSLVHVAVHGGHGEVSGLHLLREPVHLSARVAVDDGLRDGERGVQVAQGLQLPLLALDGDVKLLDTLESQFVSFHKDADGVAHELGRHLEHFQRHRGGKDGALDGFGHVLEHVVYLFFEPAGKHLIGLIQHEELHGVQAECTALDHVVDTTRGAHHDVDTFLQGADIVADSGTTDARVDFDAHEVAKSTDDLLDLQGQFAGRS